MMKLNGIKIPVTGAAPMTEKTAAKWMALGQTPVFDGMTVLGEYTKDARPVSILEGKNGFFQITFRREK